MKTPQILNRSQVAQVFGFNRSTIGDWMLKGCPILGRGRPGHPAQFDFEQLLAWRLDDLRRQGMDDAELKPGTRATRERLKQLKQGPGG